MYFQHNKGKVVHCVNEIKSLLKIHRLKSLLINFKFPHQSLTILL